MASVIGKWKIQISKNFEEYMKAIGVTDDKRVDAHKFLSDGSGMTQEFSTDGKRWTIKTCTEKGDREFSFFTEEEIESITLDGRKIKVMVTVEGDKLVEKQIGDGFECTHIRQGFGDTLTMTLVGNGQTCIRKFVKV